MRRGTDEADDDAASLMAVLLLVVLLLALLSGCTPMQLRVAFHATTVADVGTTMEALDRGCVESNPLAGEHPSDATLVGIGLLRSGLYEWGYHSVEDQPESVRKVYGWVALAVGLVGPVNNVKVMNEGCVR